MAESIKNKVAIVGMGCTKFGENWDKSYEDMLVDAAYEAFEDAGIEPKDVQAAWLGTTGRSMGLQASAALKTDYIPITRVENACASGSESLRGACYAVAAGAYDIVLALGVEKLKDMGISGLAGFRQPYSSGVDDVTTAPASFAMAATKYFDHYGIDIEEGRRLMSMISSKSHHNGSLNPKAHFQREVSVETMMKAPMIAFPLGLYHCCGVSDGAAAAIVVRADMARKFRDDPLYIKSLAIVAGPREGTMRSDFDYIHIEENVRAAKMCYAEAGITNPFKELSLAEVHDCFAITELLIYEDLGFCPRGQAKDYIESGAFTLEGELPVQPDGGLKCFGHPVGASGIRMMYEVYKQCQGKAGPRQIKNATLGLTHNLGGGPPGCLISCFTAGVE